MEHRPKLVLLGVTAWLTVSSSSYLELPGSPKFVAELFTKIQQQKLKAIPKTGSENLVLSPMSLQIALGMLYAGAKGPTKNSMKKVLGVPHKSSTYLRSYKNLLKRLQFQNDSLQIASGVFYSDKVKMLSKYKKNVKKFFKSGVEELNFDKTEEGGDLIIEWVKNNTKDAISSVVQPSDINSTGDDSVVIVNAVHFNASWQIPFNPRNTTEEEFITFLGPEVQRLKVNMMHSGPEKFFFNDYHVKLKSQILQMDYAGHCDASKVKLNAKTKSAPKAACDCLYRMVIILPSTVNGIVETLETLEAIGLQDVLGTLKSESVIVSLPKFKFENTFELGNVLKNVGLNVFDKANFKGISKKNPLTVHSVIQKLMVSVRENGTEAAAATSLGSHHSNEAASNPFIFVVNRPFIFYILPQNGDVPIFQGTVFKPDAALREALPRPKSQTSPVPKVKPTTRATTNRIRGEEGDSVENSDQSSSTGESDSKDGSLEKTKLQHAKDFRRATDDSDYDTSDD